VNTASGNSVSVTTTGALTGAAAGSNVVLTAVTLTGNGGAATLVLANNLPGASYPTKLSFQVASGVSQLFDLARHPCVFSAGVYVSTATNCAATLTFKGRGQND